MVNSNGIELVSTSFEPVSFLDTVLAVVWIIMKTIIDFMLFVLN